MSEHDEQCLLFQILSRYYQKYPWLEWTVFAIPNGGKRHPATAVKMKDEGVKSGVWDVFVAVPINNKCGMWLEMKYSKGRLSANQKAFREAVGESYEWTVCWTAEDAARAIGGYLGIEELKEFDKHGAAW